MPFGRKACPAQAESAPRKFEWSAPIQDDLSLNPRLIARLESCSGGVLRLETTAHLGRYVVANRRIEAGEVVLSDPGFAAVPFVYLDCGYCMRPLSQENPGERCDGCHTSFCSTTCAENARMLHAGECQALAALRAVKDRLRSGAPEALRWAVDARLVIRILAHRAMECQLGSAGEDKTLWTDVQMMAANEDVLEASGSSGKEVSRMYASDANVIFDLLPPALVQDLALADVKKLLLRIRFNSVTIQEGYPPLTRGKGLYPIMALLNHSCDHNSIYTFPLCGTPVDTNTRLGRTASFQEIRAIRTIEEGEQVCASYIDRFQARRARLRVLNGCYLFKCTCTRCSDSATRAKDFKGHDLSTHAYPMASADGIMCALHCSGVLAHVEEAGASLADASTDGCKGLIFFPQHRLGMNLISRPTFGGVDSDLRVTCDSCGKTHDVVELEKIELQADKTLKQIIAAWESDATQAQEQLQSFLETPGLHSHHYLVMQAHEALANTWHKLARPREEAEAIINQLGILLAWECMPRLQDNEALLRAVSEKAYPKMGELFAKAGALLLRCEMKMMQGGSVVGNDDKQAQHDSISLLMCGWACFKTCFGEGSLAARRVLSILERARLENQSSLPS
jgi:hypothetical protein